MRGVLSQLSGGGVVWVNIAHITVARPHNYIPKEGKRTEIVIIRSVTGNELELDIGWGDFLNRVEGEEP